MAGIIKIRMLRMLKSTKYMDLFESINVCRQHKLKLEQNQKWKVENQESVPLIGHFIFIIHAWHRNRIYLHSFLYNKRFHVVAVISDFLRSLAFSIAKAVLMFHWTMIIAVAASRIPFLSTTISTMIAAVSIPIAVTISIVVIIGFVAHRTLSITEKKNDSID